MGIGGNIYEFFFIKLTIFLGIAGYYLRVTVVELVFLKPRFAKVATLSFCCLYLRLTKRFLLNLGEEVLLLSSKSSETLTFLFQIALVKLLSVFLIGSWFKWLSWITVFSYISQIRLFIKSK